MRSSHQRCSIKKVLFRISQNSQENTCAGVFFNKAFNKEILAQVFPWEFCKIFKKNSLRKFGRLLLDHDLIKS